MRKKINRIQSSFFFFLLPIGSSESIDFTRRISYHGREWIVTKFVTHRFYHCFSFLLLTECDSGYFTIHDDDRNDTNLDTVALFTPWKTVNFKRSLSTLDNAILPIMAAPRHKFFFFSLSFSSNYSILFIIFFSFICNIY